MSVKQENPELNQADTDPSEKTHQGGIYLLPNLLTTAALFAGFYSIVAAMKGLFDTAAIAIFIAMIADGLDGRVARLMNAQTEFGAEYDSLSDMIAFGLAPALVIYSWSLYHLGKLGWLAAFLYTAATALRLARFNTQSSDKRYFQGLPCTAAPGVIAGMIWMGSNYNVSGPVIAIPAAILTIVIAGLMVSSIKYSSFKSIDFKGRVPFFIAVIMVLIVAGIALQPPETLFAVFFIYVSSGPVFALLEMRKMKRQRKIDRVKI